MRWSLLFLIFFLSLPVYAGPKKVDASAIIAISEDWIKHCKDGNVYCDLFETYIDDLEEMTDHNEKAKTILSKGCDKGIAWSCVSIGSKYFSSGDIIMATTYYDKGCDLKNGHACAVAARLGLERRFSEENSFLQRYNRGGVSVSEWRQFLFGPESIAYYSKIVKQIGISLELSPGNKIALDAYELIKKRMEIHNDAVESAKKRNAQHDAEFIASIEAIKQRFIERREDRQIDLLNSASKLLTDGATGASGSYGRKTCHYLRNWRSGQVNNCEYNCMGSTVVNSIGATEICPITITR